jgi:hypothetical protein
MKKQIGGIFMLKKKTKLMVLVLAILLIISTISFATEDTTTSTLPGDNAKTAETSEEGEPVVTSETEEGTAVVTSEEDETAVDETTESTDDDTTDEIRNKDLYVFDDDINMDQLVDGNVYLFGNNINVTGKVNGNLFAVGNNVTFSEDSYVVQAIYVAANQLTINGCANDLYAVANYVSMSYNSFMIRDLKVAATTFDFNGGVGRDASVYANTFNFSTTEGDDAIVYGNLTYSSSNEISVSSDYVQGDITYSKIDVSEGEDIGSVIADKLISALGVIIYAVVVLVLCMWLAPKFLEKVSSYITPAKCAKSFGIGILTVVVAVIAFFGLLFIQIGVPMGIAIIVLLALLMSISTAITGISISYKLKEKFAYKQTSYLVLTFIGIMIVFYLIGLIPYIGALVSFVINAIGLGIIVNYLINKNKVVKEENK